MCLRFVFLLITRTTSSLRLSRREETWKTAEIMILRHQLTILQRRQPRRPDLDWADRALLATLLAVIPKARRHGLRLLVTPDTILRWHRDIVRRRWAARSKRGRPAGQPLAGTQEPWSFGWPGRTLRSQAEAILACDFFTAELLDGTQAYVLAVIEHASRRIRILGVTLHPTGEWTSQQARNLRAPRGALLYRPRSGQGLEEVSLDLMADP